MSSPFRRALPGTPSLAQQKKQAKELLQSFTAGDTEARERVRAVLPDKQRISLADAQFVLAREYGFADWCGAQRSHRRPRGAATSAARADRRRLPRGATRRRATDLPAAGRAADDDRRADLLVQFARDRPLRERRRDGRHAPRARRRSESAERVVGGPFHALHIATGDAAARLLAAGAVPDACAAAHLDRVDLLARMIEEDPARVHARGGDGQTPLHFAQSRAVVDLLLEHGADIDARDVDHRATPAEWMLARHRGEGRYALAGYLVERGASADIFLAAALGLTDRARALIDADPSLLDVRTGQGRYARAAAERAAHLSLDDRRQPLSARYGRAVRPARDARAAARLRLSDPALHARLPAGRRAGGARRSARRPIAHVATRTGRSPRHHRRGLERRGRTVALMLDLGFDPRTPGHDTGTALHCAAWEGSPDTVAALLRHRDAARDVDDQGCASRRDPTRLVLPRLPVRPHRPRSRRRRPPPPRRRRATRARTRARRRRRWRQFSTVGDACTVNRLTVCR